MTNLAAKARGAAIAAAIGIAIAAAFISAPVRAGQAAVTIKMRDDPPSYSPARASVSVGDTVMWVNEGKTVLSASSNPALANIPHETLNPRHAKPFDSGFIPPGGSFSYVFTEPGTYRYFCLLHEKEKMVGVITVRE